MKKLLAILLLVTSLPCAAGIYMQKDADGNITYTDTPSSNAEPVSLDLTNSVPSTGNSSNTAKKMSASNTTDAVITDQATSNDFYKSFKIVSPANNDTIQNQPVITVKVDTDPALRAGDAIQVYLDGKAWNGPVKGTSINLDNVSRGEHTLSATLLDSAGSILKQTTPIKIFVHRASANFRAAFNNQIRLADLILPH